MQENNIKVWAEQSDRWKHVGLPTRPSAEDGEFLINSALAFLDPSHSINKVVVLGVTPEIVALDWPKNVVIDAFDISRSMIESVWAPNPKNMSHVHQSNWKSLPLEDESIPLVVGDGCLTALNGIEEAQSLFKEMHRILCYEGAIMMRCFVRPLFRENLSAVVDDAINGKIQNFGTLKWRLAMALSEYDGRVRPKLIYQEFLRCFPNVQALLDVTGWSLLSIDTIKSYDSMDSFFTFPSLEEVNAVSKQWFTIEQVFEGSYELAERCPTIIFKKKF